ncbi:hypothetical protein [Caldilinea sp.]|jgi:hypothetical protein|uniref:hypothetical protein n=1 Tax=Caldilinea sp. TaxID=2293560 RepID=UPI001B2ECA53|nr:hypothetical protein [Caldilinea sp.]MBO9392743.1 hypothetical protein [Caldilinea sp.]
MRRSIFWLLTFIVGLLLLIGPIAWRYTWSRPPADSYTPPEIPTAAIAATPIPTSTPAPVPVAGELPEMPVKRGPVVVDLAHYSAIRRDRFQPLAGALAERGVDLRFWLPTVPLESVRSFTEFPDQSEALQKILADASALVVVSPFFLYSEKEVQVVERFLADGGRLLVISDPDIESDAARDTNSLATAFNIVFHEDYLYDTVDNDANYIFFFQGDYFDQAAGLRGSRIAFYGGRSIDGAMTPQVRSASTTLSSLRIGQSHFTTAAIGGTVATNTAGRVLALSDFDVLTDPYVTRHDNRRMLEFVADFLAGGVRIQTIADFPAFFGKTVALVVDSSDPVGAQAIAKAAELQRLLELSGRSLQLGATRWLTDSTASDADLLYVARYEDASRSTTLLADIGFILEERIVTPTVRAPAVVPTVTATPAQTPSPALPPEDKTSPTPEGTPELPPLTPAPDVPPTPTPISTPLTLTAALVTPGPDIGEVTGNALVQAPAETPSPTEEPPASPGSQAGAEPTASPEATSQPSEAQSTPEATPSPEPTPTTQLFLVRNDGIQLLAEETQLFIQRIEQDSRKVVAVLGANADAVEAGLTRLMNRDFSGCLIQTELVICPYQAKAGATPSAAPAGGGAARPAPTATASADEGGDVLIVDDDRNAGEGERGEAELYAALLSRAGYAVTLWSTRERGYPMSNTLLSFRWVIWSDALYERSGVRGEALQSIGIIINSGGKVTISSRMPFFGVGAEPPSPIADVVIDPAAPDLIQGLPSDPIPLPEGLPPVIPLTRNPEQTTNATIALRRGPASAAAEAPVMMLFTDANADEPKGARLLIFGMSIAWLPDDVAEQLVQNMARVMLAEAAP